MASQYIGRQHMAAAFRREYTDRVPTRVIFGLGHFLPLTGVSPKEFLTQPEKFVEVVAKQQELIPSDAFSINVEDDALNAEAAGANSGITRQDVTAHRKEGIPILSDKATFSKFSLPAVEEIARLPYFLEVCKLANSTIKHAALDPFLPGPWSTAAIWRGVENIIYDTADDLAFVHELLRYTTEYVKMVGKALLQTGLELMTLYEPSASCTVASPDIFRNIIKPYLEEAIRSLHEFKSGVPIYAHMCGYNDPIIEDIIATGIDGLSVDELTNFKKLVEVSQGRIVIIGSTPTSLFLEGTNQQLEESIRECIDTAAEGSGYILCSGCMISDNAPIEKVRYFLEFGHEYGSKYIEKIKKA